MKQRQCRASTPIFHPTSYPQIKANSYGQSKLGYFCEVGRGGLMKDAREAARLYKLAADQGNDYAIKALQRLTSGR